MLYRNPAKSCESGLGLFGAWLLIRRPSWTFANWFVVNCRQVELRGKFQS